jgi:predicted phosphodiesterase
MAMRIAALYDIHGNLPALDAVLAELRADPPEAVVVGGDLAAGPLPVELADHPLYRGDAWAATFLSRADRDFLDALPPLLSLPVDGFGDVLFCHGSARSDEERVTRVTPDARLARLLEEAGADVVVAGHTHQQFDRGAGGRRMINAGSVGRPYEARPGAYWLRLGPDVRLVRTEYDTAAADAAFRALGYPAADLVFAPVDPDEVAERFERASGEPVSPASLIHPGENPLGAG